MSYELVVFVTETCFLDHVFYHCYTNITDHVEQNYINISEIKGQVHSKGAHK